MQSTLPSCNSTNVSLKIINEEKFNDFGIFKSESERKLATILLEGNKYFVIGQA